MLLDYIITFDNPISYGDVDGGEPSSVETEITERDDTALVSVLTPGPRTTLTVYTDMGHERLLLAVQAGLLKKNGNAVVAIFSNMEIDEDNLYLGARAWQFAAGNGWRGLF